MTRNQQWILIAIAAVIGAALVIGVIKKKNANDVPGARPAVEGTAATNAAPVRQIIPYTGAASAPRGDYDPLFNQTIQAVTGQLRMLDSALARAIMKKQLSFDDFEKLHFGGADAKIDPAYAVFNPDGKVRFRPAMGGWIDQSQLDRLTSQKGMHLYFSLRRQVDASGTTDALYAVVPAPTEKFCKQVRMSYKIKPALKFAVDNTSVVTDEAGAIPNNAIKLASCITSGDGRVYYFHPLRARFLRKGGTMWQGR